MFKSIEPPDWLLVVDKDLQLMVSLDNPVHRLASNSTAHVQMYLFISAGFVQSLIPEFQGLKNEKKKKKINQQS